MPQALTGKEHLMSINTIKEEKYMHNKIEDIVGILTDGYNFKGTMNGDLKFRFNQSCGTIELYSSFNEKIGTAYSIQSLIELLTKLRNDELA